MRHTPASHGQVASLRGGAYVRVRSRPSTATSAIANGLRSVAGRGHDPWRACRVLLRSLAARCSVQAVDEFPVLAAKEPALVSDWIKEFGNKIILSADAKKEKVAIAGWTKDSGIELTDFIKQFLPTGLL